MSGLHVTGGLIERDGWTVNAGYSTYTKHKNRWVFSADYLQKNYAYEAEQSIPLQEYSATGEFYKKLWSDVTRSFFISAGIGVLFGYETINNNRKLLNDGALIENADHYLYGATVGIESEYYYDNKYVVLIGLRERVAGGSTVNVFHTQFYVGLKIMLIN
jgi:hypothetical protein